MTVNTKKVQERQAAEAAGGDFIKFDEGHTLLFIHPPCEPGDDDEATKELPWLDVGCHYRIGKEGLMAICLDADRNPIIAHPIVQAFLAERTDPPAVDPEGCPVCQELPNMSDEERKESNFQMRHIWGVTELAFRRKAKDTFRDETHPEPKVWMGGPMIHSGLQGAFSDDDDITSMDKAMFVRVIREGTGARSTRYEVEKDLPSFREPVALSKALRRQISDALEKDCNLFRIVANMVKPTAELRLALSGVAVAREDVAEEEAEEPPVGGPDYRWEEGTPKPLPCFALDIVDDKECAACNYKFDCARHCDFSPVPGEEPEPEPEPEHEPTRPETKAERRTRLDAEAKAGGRTSGGGRQRAAVPAEESGVFTKEELADEVAPAKDNKAELDEMEEELARLGKKGKGKARSRAAAGGGR